MPRLAEIPWAWHLTPLTAPFFSAWIKLFLIWRIKKKNHIKSHLNGLIQTPMVSGLKVIVVSATLTPLVFIFKNNPRNTTNTACSRSSISSSSSFFQPQCFKGSFEAATITEKQFLRTKPLDLNYLFTWSVVVGAGFWFSMARFVRGQVSEGPSWCTFSRLRKLLDRSALSFEWKCLLKE